MILLRKVKKKISFQPIKQKTLSINLERVFFIQIKYYF